MTKSQLAPLAVFGAFMFIFVGGYFHSLSTVSRSQALRESLPTPVASPVDNASSVRQQFARGMGKMMTENKSLLRNVSVTTSDAADTTLVITADNIIEDDANLIVRSSYAGAMEMAGFEILVCRSRACGEWSKRLLPDVR